MGRRLLIVLCVIVLVLLLIAGILLRSRSGHLTLLTVQEMENGTAGGTADLYLTITPGTGQVYLATYPFAKVDTQISTRFAKEVACSFLDADCDRYDFFYLIRADSSIIGGPSAGAALAGLTAALLDHQQIDQGVAVTGTISAGGIVGPVGGVGEKALAAEQDGLHTVVVPRWSGANESNISYPGDLQVVKVTGLGEVLQQLTGKQYSAHDSLVVPPAYTSLMGAVADQLCNRSDALLLQVPTSNDTLYNLSMDFLAKAAAAEQSGSSYSRASYCFSANLRLRELQLRPLNASQLGAAAKEVAGRIGAAQQDLQARSLTTFTDLQTKAIVDDRLREAQSYLADGNDSAANVAYALERYRSAMIWSSFFSLPGEPLTLDDAALKAACEEKLAEVEERHSYLTLLFNQEVLDTSTLEDAYAMYGAGDYALCIFKASTAKAQADVVLSSLAIDENDFSMLLQEQLAVAQGVIARESLHDRFPIMGYSYYEYASSLAEDDPYTASLFASYALELGDVRMYFKTQQRGSFLRALLADRFLRGILVGMLLTSLFVLVFLGKRKVQKKRARRKA